MKQSVREGLVAFYGCVRPGECIDAHVGQAFWRGSDGKVVSSPTAWYSSASPGDVIDVKSFALQSCAPLKLVGVQLTTSTTKNQDSIMQGSPTPAAKTTAAADSSKKVAAVSTADLALEEAQKKVDAAAAKAEEAAKTAAAHLMVLSDPARLCKDGKNCQDAAAELKFRVTALANPSDAKEAESLGNIETLLADRVRVPKPSPSAEKATMAVKMAQQTVAAATDDVGHAIATLETQVSGLKSSLPDLYSIVAPTIERAKMASPKAASEALKEASTQMKAFRVASAAATSGENAWPAIMVESGELVSVIDHSAPVPDGDDNRLFLLTTSDSTKGGSDTSAEPPRPLWPNNTMTVRINHGRYHLDAGFLFAGVFHGTAKFDSSAMTTSSTTSSTSSSSPTSYATAFQSLLAVNIYPAGRDKFVPASWWGLFPGIQVGLNADLTKITNAVSLGAIFEPVSGVAISGGGVLYARGSGPATANGSQPTEHVFLPYVGLSLNTQAYNSVKAVTSPSGSDSPDSKK